MSRYEERIERAVLSHMDMWRDMSDDFLDHQTRHPVPWHREAAKELLKQREGQRSLLNRQETEK